jgi:hypothetical protein
MRSVVVSQDVFGFPSRNIPMHAYASIAKAAPTAPIRRPDLIERATAPLVGTVAGAVVLVELLVVVAVLPLDEVKVTAE